MQAEALDILMRGVEMAAGASLLAWAKTIDAEKVDFEPAVRFVREMRDER